MESEMPKRPWDRKRYPQDEKIEKEEYKKREQKTP